MKTIELKNVKFSAFGMEQNLDYKTMLQTILEAPANPKEGATIDEIRKSIRLLDVLEDAKEKVKIEDADYEYLLKRVQGTKFTSSNRAFIDFVECIEGAQ